MMKIKSIIAILAITVMAFTTTGIKAQQNLQTQPQNQTQQSSADVSDKEMKEFVKIANELRTVRQGSQQKMSKAIQENGMEVSRYQSIMKAQQRGDSVDISEDEKKSLSAINNDLKKIQQEMQQNSQKIIQNSSMSSDKELQQKFRNMQSEM